MLRLTLRRPGPKWINLRTWRLWRKPERGGGVPGNGLNASARYWADSLESPTYSFPLCVTNRCFTGYFIPPPVIPPPHHHHFTFTEWRRLCQTPLSRIAEEFAEQKSSSKSVHVSIALQLNDTQSDTIIITINNLSSSLVLYVIVFEKRLKAKVFIFDSGLSFNAQVTKVLQSWFAHLRQWTKIRSSLPMQAKKMSLIAALHWYPVSFRGDCTTLLLYCFYSLEWTSSCLYLQSANSPWAWWSNNLQMAGNPILTCYKTAQTLTS